MPRKKPAPEPGRLIATIEAVEQSYFIAQHREHGDAFDDEAILDVTGRIAEIGSRHRQHLGQEIEMSFICPRRFTSDSNGPSGKPSMFGVTLKKDQRSLLVYLPADAFWALPAMIASKAVTHIEVSFGDYRYGRADLLSLHFTPASKLTRPFP